MVISPWFYNDASFLVGCVWLDNMKIKHKKNFRLLFKFEGVENFGTFGVHSFGKRFTFPATLLNGGCSMLQPNAHAR